MNKKKTPGQLIKTLCLDSLNLSVTDAAKALKVSRQVLSMLINGRLHITPSMALRLEQVFNTDARSWLMLQLEYDLEQAKKKKLNLQRVSKKRIRVPKTLA